MTTYLGPTSFHTGSGAGLTCRLPVILKLAIVSIETCPVALRSGEADGHGVCSHMELRDTKAVFFITCLPQGVRALTYRLRAETPGRFHVLPARGYAMYAPELRGTSGEGRLGLSGEW